MVEKLETESDDEIHGRIRRYALRQPWERRPRLDLLEYRPRTRARPQAQQPFGFGVAGVHSRLKRVPGVTEQESDGMWERVSNLQYLRQRGKYPYAVAVIDTYGDIAGAVLEWDPIPDDAHQAARAHHVLWTTGIPGGPTYHALPELGEEGVIAISPELLVFEDGSTFRPPYQHYSLPVGIHYHGRDRRSKDTMPPRSPGAKQDIRDLLRKYAGWKRSVAILGDDPSILERMTAGKARTPLSFWNRQFGSSPPESVPPALVKAAHDYRDSERIQPPTQVGRPPEYRGLPDSSGQSQYSRGRGRTQYQLTPT